MEAEREALVKDAFPRLRAYCEERGVTFAGVELRTGIPDEQVFRGEALIPCFKQIARCRLFLGLLADHYGSSLPIPESLLRDYPWLADLTDRSFTELEFRHGALNRPPSDGTAFFCFRAGGGHKDPKLLRELKEEVSAKLPFVTYGGPDDLVSRVCDHFEKVLDELFPTGELDHRGREAAAHNAFRLERTTVFQGRTEDLQALEDTLEANGRVVLTGSVGIGKSALVANWLDGRPSNGIVIEHYVDASEYSTDVPAMLRRILTELMFESGISGEIPEEPTAGDLHRWLTAAGAISPLLLVIDGIDHLIVPDERAPLHWMPRGRSKGVRVVVSTARVDHVRELDRLGWASLELEPLPSEAVLAVSDEFLALHGMELDRYLRPMLRATPAVGNPAFLTLFLEEVHQCGELGGLSELFISYLSARDAVELFLRILLRYQRDYDRDRPGFVGLSMCLIWAARRGLPEADLLDFLGTAEEPFPQLHWTRLFLAAERTVWRYRRGNLVVAGALQREAVERLFVRQIGERVVRSRLVHSILYRGGSYRTKLNELLHQLCELEDWENLVKPLADPKFFEDFWRTDRIAAAQHWALLEKQGGIRATDAYSAAIEAPESFGSPRTIWFLATLLGGMGHTEEAIELWRWLVARYRECGDDANSVAALGNLAPLYGRIGHAAHALAALTEQEAVAKRLGDEQQQALALLNRANVLFFTTDLPAARKALAEHRDLVDRSGDLKGVLENLNCLGNIQLKEGRKEQAAASFKKSAELANELGMLEAFQAAVGNLGTTLMDLGEHQQALDRLREQERICRQIGYREGLVGALGNLGLLLRTLGRTKEAVPLHREELAVAAEIGFAYGLRQGRGHLADALFDAKRYREALQEYRQYVRTCHTQGATEEEWRGRHQIGLTLILFGDGTPAQTEKLDLYRQAREVAVRIGDHPLLELAEQRLFQHERPE